MHLNVQCLLWFPGIVCFFFLDKIPYFEAGDYVAYNNEKGGLIECLKKDVVDIDPGLSSLADWTPMKVMLTTWLADALAYELWVGGDSSSAYNIYYSGLPWPIGKFLFWKQAHFLKLQYGVTKDNAEVKEEEVSFSCVFDALFENTRGDGEFPPLMSNTFYFLGFSFFPMINIVFS